MLFNLSCLVFFPFYILYVTHGPIFRPFFQAIPPQWSAEHKVSVHPQWNIFAQVSVLLLLFGGGALFGLLALLGSPNCSSPFSLSLMTLHVLLSSGAQQWPPWGAWWWRRYSELSSVLPSSFWKGVEWGFRVSYSSWKNLTLSYVVLHCYSQFWEMFTLMTFKIKSNFFYLHYNIVK